MPHLYLNQRCNADLIEDLEGGNYSSLEDAFRDAIVSARQSMAESVRRGLLSDGWRFEIVDGCGVLLAVIPFDETLSPDGSVEGAKHRWYRN